MRLVIVRVRVRDVPVRTIAMCGIGVAIIVPVAMGQPLQLILMILMRPARVAIR
jgi:hypothetical protein